MASSSVLSHVTTEALQVMGMSHTSVGTIWFPRKNPCNWGPEVTSAYIVSLGHQLGRSAGCFRVALNVYYKSKDIFSLKCIDQLMSVNTFEGNYSPEELVGAALVSPHDYSVTAFIGLPAAVAGRKITQPFENRSEICLSTGNGVSHDKRVTLPNHDVIFAFNTMHPYVSQNRQIRSIQLSKFDRTVNCVAFKPMYIDVGQIYSMYPRCL